MKKLESIERILHHGDLMEQAKFSRKVVPDARKRKLQYDGHAAVLITAEETPVTMIYDIKNNALKTFFSIQRYNAADFTVDTTVQAKVDLP